MENLTDKTFRKKIDQLHDLPEEVTWTPVIGWREYEQKYSGRRLIRKKIMVYLSSAAALLLIIIISILVPQKSRHKRMLISNNADTIREIVLPGQNRVWLNKKSSIEYPRKMNRRPHDFKVTGEVYFEITNPDGEEYTINANRAVIILENSTALNIRARSDEENVNVTVAKGACKVMNETREKGLTLLVTEGNYCSVH